MGPRQDRGKDVVCGDAGVEELLLCCSRCKHAARHRYCLDVILLNSALEWLCSDCIPKHNEASGSLEGESSQRKLTNTQFSSSIIKEPNAEKEKLTVARGLNRNRAHPKGNDHVVESAKHCPSRDTSNRGFKLASNSVECPSLSNVRSGYFASSNYAERLVSRGRKADIFSLIKDIKGSHTMVKDKSHRTSASVERVDISSVNREKSQSLRAVKGLEKNRRSSNPSMANERLVSNKGNSGEADRRSDKKMRRRRSVDSKVNRISDPDSAQGNPNASITGMTSYLSKVKRMRIKRMLREEGITINSELLASMFVGPCESAKINPRKRKQSERNTPDGIKYQKARIINQLKNVNAARLRSNRPTPVAASRDRENMPRKENSSSDKVIGHSKQGKDKKMEKSDLARKASGGSRKTSSVLQPSSGERSSVDRSIPYSKSMDLALKKGSYPLSNPRGSCAALIAELCSTAMELRNYSEPKKRRRLILPYDEEEDDEPLHVVDSNARSCENDGQTKQQIKCVENAVKNPRRCVEALRSENWNHQCSNYYKRVKKQRRIEANKDDNESSRNLNAGGAEPENDVSQLALQTGGIEDHSSILRMPLIPESIGGQPLDKPYWTGIMKIDDNYIPLSAHLSTKAGEKVRELSRSLPPLMKVAKHSPLKSCPEHWEAPIPSADSINLYLFCGDTRPNKELDQLAKHVADSGIILEAIVGLDKLCIFPSSVLPEECQTFQGKPYLWGVFKPRKDEIKRLAAAEEDCTAHVTEEEEHVQEQHVLEQQNKVRADTQDQAEKQQPLLGANPEVGDEALSAGNVLPLIDMRAAASANISPADHGQPSSNPQAPPPRVCGFVVSRTPRSVQLIQEMQKEGALLFAVQQVAAEPGSLV